MCFKTKCSECKKQYLRDISCRNHKNDVHDHFTGRYCTDCKGKLNDTIINFNEYLMEEVMESCDYHLKKADLIICLGSSLRVSPFAAEHAVVSKISLVICNKQTTPYDDYCKLRVFGQCDELMISTMEKLSLKIPPFVLSRRLKIGVKEENKYYLKGLDIDDTEASWFKKVMMRGEEIKKAVFDIEDVNEEVIFEFEFSKHLNEPNLKFKHSFKNEITYLFKLDVLNDEKWTIYKESEKSIQDSIDEFQNYLKKKEKMIKEKELKNKEKELIDE
jgi:hypothetical protein